MLRVVRIVGFVVLAGVAVVVYFVMAPEQRSTSMDDEEIQVSLDQIDANQSRLSRAVDEALERQELNEDSADSAPQQQVVNGWATVDVLAAVADQTTTIEETAALIAASAPEPSDDRIPTLLLLTALAVCWGFATSTQPPAAPSEGSAPSAPTPPPFNPTPQRPDPSNTRR